MTQDARDAGERIELRGGWYFGPITGKSPLWVLCAPGGRNIDLWSDTEARAFAAAQLAPGTRDEGLEIAAGIISEKNRADAIRLAAGEMTAQEMRTAKAVLSWVEALIRAKIAKRPDAPMPKPVVTEEMLDRALTVWFGEHEWDSSSPGLIEGWRKDMRAVLEAVASDLAASQGGA